MILPATQIAANPPIRVLTRSNKGHPSQSYSPTSNRVKRALILVLFCVALNPVEARNVVVLQKLGAVAEKVPEVALDLCAGQFSMVLRLGIDDSVNVESHF